MSAGILLSALFDGLVADVPDCHVPDMTSDSRQVVPGGLFIACRGVHQHGLEYLPEALAAGAGAVAWEPEAGLAAPEVPRGVVVFPVDMLGEQLGMIADRFFAMPSSAMSVTGITGTNGKTTTAWLLAQ
ncbi:MAG: UDP-N-acetylmuramoyl-L-alanyl-D-glutamate--2,6-diaminopimelate ligase, partial [Gammaproteobacteria bacterium]